MPKLQPRVLENTSHFCVKCGRAATYIYDGKYLCTVDTQILVLQDNLEDEADAKAAKDKETSSEIEAAPNKAPVKPIIPQPVHTAGLVQEVKKGATTNATQPAAAKATVAGTTKAT